MRILVTGGAGYVGSVTVERLVAAGHRAVVLDDLTTGHRTAVAPEARFVEGRYDAGDALAALLEEERIDAVLHCAAKSIVGESVARPDLYYRENVVGGIALLDALRAAGVRRLVLSSTAAVYGLPAVSPIPETAALAPINPYGETKRTLEGAIRWYGVAHGLRSISLRYFNAAGASERNGERHAPETHLVPLVLEAAEGGPPIAVFGADYPTPDGTCIRDYIHVEDLADAHLAALEATSPDDPRTGPAGGSEPLALNLGTAGGYSVREVLAAAERVVGSPIPSRVGERRAGDPPSLVADATRAGDVLGWQARRAGLEAIIGSAWEWRRRHPDGYPA
jgi:UDP-glucose 4-epimerase